MANTTNGITLKSVNAEKIKEFNKTPQGKKFLAVFAFNEGKSIKEFFADESIVKDGEKNGSK